MIVKNGAQQTITGMGMMDTLLRLRTGLNYMALEIKSSELPGLALFPRG
jgi:hypothetical protein